MSTPITTFDGLDDGTDLAVVVGGGRIERWEWRDGVMQKNGGVRLPPFFFSGLLADQKIMPGNFAPPVRGEWFAIEGSQWSYLVLSEKSERLYRCAYFRREHFYDWREVGMGDLLDSCTRVDAPAWASEQYVAMAVLCSDTHQERIAAEQHSRSVRNARTNMTYARDYLVRALEQMERTTA